MAIVESISLFGWNMKDGTMRVKMKFEPCGELSIDIPIPVDFHTSIVQMARAAAAVKEAEMRATIVASTLSDHLKQPLDGYASGKAS